MPSIPKLSATDAVIKSLEQRILSGALLPGEKLPTEAELAADFAVSRSTVREAVRFLQAIGYVEMRPGKGAFLLTDSPTRADSGKKWLSESRVRLTDFLEVRRILEPFAAKQAALRMTDSEISRLSNIFEAFETAYRAHDITTLSYYDSKFHLAIVQGSGNALLLRLHKESAQLFQEYCSRSSRIEESFADALEPHRRILEAICAHDADLAEFEMLSHIMLSFRHFRLLASALEEGSSANDTESESL